MKAWLATRGVAVVGLLFAWFGGNARGKAKAKQQAAEKTIKMVRKAHEASDDVHRLSDDDIRKRLHDEWQRD